MNALGIVGDFHPRYLNSFCNWLPQCSVLRIYVVAIVTVVTRLGRQNVLLTFSKFGWTEIGGTRKHFSEIFGRKIT